MNIINAIDICQRDKNAILHNQKFDYCLTINKNQYDEEFFVKCNKKGVIDKPEVKYSLNIIDIMSSSWDILKKRL